jgi:membrane fusion protein, heavy metal efflux system
MNTLLRSLVSNKWLGFAVVAAIMVSSASTFRWWWPIVSSFVDTTVAANKTATSEEHDHDVAHAEDHAHAHHEDGTSIPVSSQALKNLGLTGEFLKPIELSDYKRSVSVPAIITARPGRTQIQVSSPMSGVVTHVHAVPGEAVSPGDLLFEVRLTYEDLVDTQTQFVKNLSDLEVEEREIARLEEVTRSGAVASKTLLERQYAKQKLESQISSQREALKLHGLSDMQISKVQNERRLLRDLQIVAPNIDQHDHDEELRLSERIIKPVSYGDQAHLSSINRLTRFSHPSHPLIVDELQVQKGQGVVAGERLCSLSDYSVLYIEGKAFEQDAPAIAQAAEKGWAIDAVLPSTTSDERVSSLKLVFVANEVDQEARTLSFFVELPNEALKDETNSEGQRYIAWKYRIGQRLQLQVPVDVWTNQIVLPVDAVVKDGAEWFVFQQNGEHFDRAPVHIKHRDQSSVVIDNDGSIYPGDVVALKSAHQLQMALKNMSGGGVDPHAGHSH